jgi:hypothetical protein
MRYVNVNRETLRPFYWVTYPGRELAENNRADDELTLPVEMGGGFKERVVKVCLEAKDCEVELEALPEDMELEGNVSAMGDPDVDEAAEQAVREKLESGNEWAWCVAKVSVEYEGVEESAYLGGCSYESAEDFKEPGGHYADMVEEALGELRARFLQALRASETPA